MIIQNLALTPIIVLIIQGLLAWALWSIRQAFVREEDYAEHLEYTSNIHQEFSSRLNTLEGRLLGLEDRLSLAPSSTSITQLASAVEHLRGDIKTLDMRITGLDRLIQRIERNLERQDLILHSNQLPKQ